MTTISSSGPKFASTVRAIRHKAPKTRDSREKYYLSIFQVNTFLQIEKAYYPETYPTLFHSHVFLTRPTPGDRIH